MDARKIRPKKKNLKNNRVQILLSQEERDLIVASAQKEGLPLGTWIRWKLLRGLVN